MNKSIIPGVVSQNEFWTSERCYIQELLNNPDVPEVSLARCRVEPGVTTQLHQLSVMELYVVASGTGLMEVGGQPSFVVGEGDSVYIAAGEAQRITNTGSADLVFQCICMPRFYPECYLSLEDDE
ncbi:MAG: cupin domain-containing protein [Pseudomonadales bacterium]|nr:cupin domain-containing protein [Pseudomonadales bacterium]